MSRGDLRALTPEAIAALANLGLVKRAQREIEAGKGPVLAESGGAVTATFADGVVTTLPPDKPFTGAECTCGASAVCRHRVALALAYAASAPASARAWSPASFDDAAFSPAVRKRADTLAKKGIVIELEPSAARLPTTTVRFLVPERLDYAQCDCTAAKPCAHMLLAVRAFREAAHLGREPPCTIDLDAPRPMPTSRTSKHGATHADAASGDARPLPPGEAARPLPPGEAASGALHVGEALALVERVLVGGVVGVPEEEAWFVRVSEALARERLVWLRVIVERVAALLAAYRARSARYRTGDLVFLLASLAARSRAAAERGELPARRLFGSDEAEETPLDRVRLVSLGARVVADGERRVASVYLAEASTGAVSALERTFEAPREGPALAGPALASRSVATGVKLGALAAGQLVTRAATRHASHALTLRERRGVQSSVAPSTGDWETLPSSLLVRGRDTLAERLARRPPRLLRPPVLAEGLVVLADVEVTAVAYRPGDEELIAIASGIPIVRRHSRAAPAALDVLARALEAGPRFIAGEASFGPHGLMLDPTAVVTDRVVVPDLEEAPALLERLPRAAAATRTELEIAVERAGAVLEESLHDGLAHLGRGFADRTEEAARTAAGRGLVGLEHRLLALRSALADPAAAARAWLDLAIRTELTREAITA
ncbi:MAG: hypothetical protein KIT84_19835 [Labilithrix sp.]|nr:hypothetical protein [Labilithrix sp.]MCW5813289.1 hypothetical protein [Labilithrix sp.]